MRKVDILELTLHGLGQITIHSLELSRHEGISLNRYSYCESLIASLRLQTYLSADCSIRLFKNAKPITKHDRSLSALQPRKKNLEERNEPKSPQFKLLALRKSSRNAAG